MKMNRLLTAFTFGALFCSWNLIKKNPIDKAGWLIGTWENNTKRGIIYETWTKSGDAVLNGKSYSIKNSDTTIFENIELIQQQESLFYISKVQGQNNNLPVRFSLQKISEDQFVFENLTHDFPQIISYTKITRDSLLAEISGVSNGKSRKQSFPMRRIK